MVERFNFYDVYGYLIPGLIFLTLLWLPYALVDGGFANMDWSSALLALLVFSYVLGHLIQGLAIAALPSGKPRYPSDILLDDGDRSFSPEVKSRLVNRILLQFDIDVRDATNLNADIHRKRRLDAFMLCRRTLIQKGVVSYAEQFEGMYALMRGVAAACILGGAYYLSLLSRVAGGFFDEPTRVWFWSASVVMVPIFIVAIVIVEVTRPKSCTNLLFWFVVGLLYLLAGLSVRNEPEWLKSFWVLLGICLALGFTALRCYGAYHDFSRRFAETVYRDFCAL